MKLLYLIRRVAVIACLAALCAAPAMARRVSSPPPDENVSHTQPHAPAVEIVTPAVNHPGNANPDEPPTCVTPPSRTTSAGRMDINRAPAPDAPRLPAAPVSDTDRREKAKTTAPTLSPRVVRTPVQRARVNTHSRPLPATPGMGTLLRMGMTVGREISFLDESPIQRPSRTHTGRAPPRLVSTPNSAQTSPVAPQHFAESLLPGSAPTLPNEQLGRNPRTDAHDHRALDRTGMPCRARSAPVAVPPSGGTTT